MIPILLIDDDMELSKLLDEYLLAEQIQLQPAYDGITGLENALQHPYAIVILDLMLPGMSGLEVLKHLRRESTIPVLVVSACGGEKDRIAVLELGANDYLAKPFRPQELVARLRSILKTSSWPAVPFQ